jgi:hypothetical protein
MSFVKVLAVLAALSAPIGCVASSEPAPEATGSTSDAILAAADLKDYGFTYFDFSADYLKAGLTITDPAGVPYEFSIDGVDKSATQKITSTLKLVSIDATNKVGLYALAGGAPLGSYYDILPNTKSLLTAKDFVVAPSFYTISIYTCKVYKKPPGPPRCFIFPSLSSN